MSAGTKNSDVYRLHTSLQLCLSKCWCMLAHSVEAYNDEYAEESRMNNNDHMIKGQRSLLESTPLNFLQFI